MLIETRILDDVRLVAKGFEFPEGPVVLPDGSVALTEIEGAKVVRVDQDGAVDLIAACAGGPNGAALGPDGALYVCNNGGRFASGTYDGGWIERVDLDSGQVERLITEHDGRKLSGPNDIVFDTAGGFWFTDTGKFRGRVRDIGSIYYVEAGSDVAVEVIHPAESPNGIGLSPDGRVLYYAETMTARLRRRQITGPGQVAPAGAHDPETLVCGLPGDQLFDSLALTSSGSICIGTMLTGVITEASADGSQVTQWQFPPEFADRLPTNICFGGDELATAYITAAQTGSLYACTWPTPGLPLNQ